MGMAASQARFLNLTARRTNIEYQGQQINQQRTELSNESANLYNQMLSLQVPVPPNTQDYTRIEYSFTIPGSFDTQATVTQFAKTTVPGEYTVIFNYTEKELGFPACTTSERSDVSNTHVSSDAAAAYTYPGLQTQIRHKAGGGFEYLDSSNNWTTVVPVEYGSTPPGDPTDESVWNQLGCTTASTTQLYVMTINGTKQYFTADQINGLAPSTSTDPGAAQSLQAYQAATISSGDNFAGEKIATYKGKTATLRYVSPNDSLHKDAYEALSNSGATQVWVANVGTEEKPVYQYYTTEDIKAAKSLGGDEHCVYYTASDIDVYKEDSYTPVTIIRDGNNRVQSFNYKGEDYAVKANTITDQQAYDDAMNEYTYQSYLYEQAMNNINAKTSIIQVQDRELELKLKQLDTEHNAVQTEMDAVKAVCKKNVEDSFKTFA